jgi:hypothetical protein
MTNQVRQWIHGLGAAVIGGGASAVTAGVTVSAIRPDTFNFAGQVWPTLELMLALFVVNGAVSAFAYLKQSPLPAETLEVTKTETVTVTETPK